MGISDWEGRFDSLKDACRNRKATGRWGEGIDKPPRFEFGAPATERELVAIETQVGRPIPDSLRKVLSKFSGNICIEWQLREDFAMPDALRKIFAGECRWELTQLPALQATYHGWITACFSNPEDAYDGVWHHKFPILEIGNGDMLGIDLQSPVHQPVVYLSHDGSSLHGYWMGEDFEDYVNRLSMLGCVGSEDWQLAPFLCGPKCYVETDSANARQWREWFGLELA